MINQLTTNHFFSLNHSKNVVDLIRSLPLPETITLNGVKHPILTTFDSITFGQKCLLDQVVYNSDHDLIKKILSILYYSMIFDCKFDSDKYTNCESIINESLICESYPVTLYYVELLNQTNETERELLKEKPDPEQVMAGIEELSAFGVIGVVHGLANKRIVDHEKIYELTYIHVLTVLQYEKAEREFNRRYQEILNPKK